MEENTKREIDQFLGYLKVNSGVTEVDALFFGGKFIRTDAPLPEYADFLLIEKRASVSHIFQANMERTISDDFVSIAANILRAVREKYNGEFVIGYSFHIDGWDYKTVGCALCKENYMIRESEMLDSLKNYSTETLAQEIERRRVGDKPAPIAYPDLTDLRAACEGVLDDPGDEDGKHYVYEAAMTALYGEDVFNYINKILR